MSRDIRNIEWREDSDGRYWIGELWRDGKRVGYIGNYYCRECMPPGEDGILPEGLANAALDKRP